MDILSNYDFKKNQLLNALMQKIAGDHGSPVEAIFWWDSTAHVMKVYDGTTVQTVAFSSGSGILASLYDAYTVLAADTDNTPAPVTLGASTILGRRSTGGIVAMTIAQLVTELLAQDGTGSLLDADKLDGQEGTYYLDRANHSGTQLAATISNLAAVVQAYRLDQFAVPTADLSLNSHKLTNVTDPSAAQDAATKAYVDALIQGISAKTSVRVATTANATLASGFENGDTVDGVTLVTGDRILIKDQSTGSQNGIYTVNASGAPTRATDMDSNAEIAAGLYVFVEEGTTNADSGWVLTTDGAITVGTTSLAFVQFTGAGQITAGAALTKTGNTLDVAVDGTTIEISGDALRVKDGGISDAKLASTFAKKYTTTVGDGATTAIVVTHNLGTRAVQVTVYRTATPYDQVMVNNERTTTNTVTLGFAVAPSAAEFTVVVTG